MTATTRAAPNVGAIGLSWIGIVRLGLVQTAIGALVVLPTSTFNRVMTVELGLAAVLPAGLVAWHYLVQLSRPRWGYGSDVGRARTPWIIGGVAALGAGALLAAQSVALLQASIGAGLALAVVAYSLIGGGVAAAGTSLLALLATKTAPQRRPAAAAVTWVMMILGIVITARVAGSFLDPFTPLRLTLVTAAVAGVALLLTVVAVWGLERRAIDAATADESSSLDAAPKASFAETMQQVWSDRMARAFTVFVFVSMLAYNMQDMILEPFAGLVFGYSLGQSTQLAGMQHAGVLLGMILIGVVGARTGGHDGSGLRRWMIAGCVGSALALTGLAWSGMALWREGFQPLVFAMGFCNGVFAVSAIGAMMAYAGAGRRGQEGVRMGVWGAAQAMAFGAGGLLGAALADGFRRVSASDALGFGGAFALEACLFAVSAVLAMRLTGVSLPKARPLPAMPTDFAAGQIGATVSGADTPSVRAAS